MQWKDFLYFNKRERKGIITLLILIFIGLLLGFLYDKYNRANSKLSFVEDDFTELMPTQEKDSTKLSSAKNRQDHREKKGSCDLNTATFEDFIDRGIPKHVAQNIINYRNKATRYYKLSELQKLYTMTDSTFTKIESQFYIKALKEEIPQKRLANSTQTDTPKYYNRKFTTDTLININDCDTTILKQIPGIGSYTARKIVRYGERLGGYHNIDQLYEIKVDSALIVKWFKIDPNTHVKKVDINNVEFSELLKHPYFEYEDVKAIFNYKRKHGKLKSIKELQMIELFDSLKIERIAPYLRFS